MATTWLVLIQVVISAEYVDIREVREAKFHQMEKVFSTLPVVSKVVALFKLGTRYSSKYGSRCLGWKWSCDPNYHGMLRYRC